MRAIVVAVSMRSGGGLSVGLNFLMAASQNLRGDDELHVLVADAAGYERLEGRDGIVLHKAPAYLANWWLRPVLDYGWIRRRVYDINPDVVFSMGNFPLNTERPQLTLFHQPYLIYPDNEGWSRMSRRMVLIEKLRIYHFRQRLRYTDVIAVQTPTAATRVARMYNVPGDLVVIPNAVAIPPADETQAGARIRNALVGDGKHLLCLTRYYSHKNLEVLLDVAELALRRNSNYVFVLTIDPQQSAAAEHMLKQIEHRGLKKIVQNVGAVALEDVPTLYRLADAFILPTLLESFSGTYVEAMHFGVPIFTSDRDFARDVCGDAAMYFDPTDPNDIYRVLDQTFMDNATLESLTKRGKERVANHPSWQDVSRMYLDVLRRLATSEPIEAATNV